MAEPSVGRQLARLANSVSGLDQGFQGLHQLVQAIQQEVREGMVNFGSLQQTVQGLVQEVHQATTQIQELRQQLADQQTTEQQLQDLEQQLTDARDQLAAAFQGGDQGGDQGGGSQPPADQGGGQQPPALQSGQRVSPSIIAARAAQRQPAEKTPQQPPPMPMRQQR